jgi:hypothetical protein
LHNPLVGEVCHLPKRRSGAEKYFSGDKQKKRMINSPFVQHEKVIGLGNQIYTLRQHDYLLTKFKPDKT